MEPKAIPLVVYEKGEFHVSQESLEFLKTIEGKIAVIAVVGKYRTGKSFLLNRIILENRGRSGFGVGPTINPCTKGLWIWSQGVEIELDGEKITVLVIDSEGLGAFDEDANHDTRIFLLALLLSSYFIYNSVGSIDESALQNLSLIVNLSKQIQVKTGQTSIEEISTYFPSFLWVLRDFALRLIDSQGNPISTKEYLENALTPTKGVSDSVEAKNRIRRLLTSFFTDRDCFALVRPTESEKSLQNLDQADDSVFRPEFLEMASKLRRHIFRKAKVKTLNKSCLNGEMLGNLAVTYVNAINKGGVPNIEGAWASVCHAECVKNIEDSVSETEAVLRKIELPLNDEEFKKKYKELQENVIHNFKSKAIGENVEQYIKMLAEKIREKKKTFLQKNYRIYEESIEKDTQEMYYSIQEKIREGELTSIQDAKSIINSFLKTKNQQNLPLYIKSRLLELALDYQEQAIDLITRNSSLIMQNEIKKITSQLDLANEQSTRKKTEFENEKNYLRNKIDELERESSNSKGMNAILTARNEELVKDKKRFEESFEERMQYLKENCSEKVNEIKEKYTKTSSKLNEVESRYSKTIADLQKENMLLKQELEFKTKEINELKERSKDLEASLKNSRNRNKSIEYTEKKEETGDWNSERQFLKSQIESLKAHIEDNKGIQEALMAALNSKATDNPQYIDKAYETNKHLSFALDKSEENCKKLEQKLKKIKKFQKIVKNSSSVQCKKCNKYFVAPSFLQHIANCEGETKETTTIIVSILKTVIKETDNKPYTEYVLSVTLNGKALTVYRKYKMFCNLHLSLQQQFPHIDLPDLLGSYEVPPKSMLTEERRKNFENYLVQLLQITVIRESLVFRKFIGIEDPGKQSESPVQSKRGKSNIELITSRAFSPTRNVLGLLTNTIEKKN